MVPPGAHPVTSCVGDPASGNRLPAGGKGGDGADRGGRTKGSEVHTLSLIDPLQPVEVLLRSVDRVVVDAALIGVCGVRGQLLGIIERFLVHGEGLVEPHRGVAKQCLVARFDGAVSVQFDEKPIGAARHLNAGA